MERIEVQNQLKRHTLSGPKVGGHSAGDLIRDSVVAKNATTGTDGKPYQIEYCNLDAIISVGYRVNSIRGTQFRIWTS